MLDVSGGGTSRAAADNEVNASSRSQHVLLAIGDSSRPGAGKADEGGSEIDEEGVRSVESN